MAVIQTSFLSDSEDRRNLLQTQPSDSAVAMPLHVPASLSNALQDRKSGQDQPGAMAQVREQAQSAGIAREEYPINLSFQQWDVLNRMANQTENPEEALSRYAAATLFSKEYDVPFENALENLDAYSEHLMGTAFSGNTSAVQSIVNAFKAGRKNMNYSDLAAQFKRMDMRGEDTTEVLAQLSAVSEEILALKDNQPRNVITKMLQVTAESALPYMIEVTKASALGSLAMGSVAGAWQLASGVALGSITAAAPWTLAALMAVGGTVAAINRTRELEEGVMYLQLRELGIDKDIADPVSRFTGLTVGWIEAAFGVEFATLSKLVGWEASSALTASLSSSGWFQGFIKGLANLTGNAANEFLQEALEKVQDHASVHLAHAIQSHRGEVEELPDVDIIRDTFEAGLSGFASALVLGIPGLAIDVRQGFKGAVEIRDNARANPSKEAFIKQVSEAKPESMTQGQWNEAMSHLWEKENADQPLSSAIQSDEAAIAELDVGEGKKGRPEGRVQRLSSGRLYMGEADTITVDRSGAEHHQALVGDPRTGRRYGYIEYSLTDNAIDIESVRTRSGYESIRKEAIIELARRYPGYEITWNTANETLAKIKEEIISENPLGAEKGLQYFDGLTDVDDRLYVEAQIKKAMPNLNATERALGATLIQLRAENEGLDAQSYLEATYQNGEIFGAIDSKTVELLEGKKGAAQFSKDLKAVIYAGQNADFSTFVHETFHVSLRQLQDRSELGTAIREAAGTKEFVQWLEEHRDLFSDSNFSEMDTAALVEIAQKFDESALNRQQEEFSARLFEGYLLDGKSASKRLGAFLEHIATWMRKIYNTIANRVALDDRIVKAFDAIFEANERAQEADGAEQSSTPAETQISSETKEAQKPESSFIPLGSEEANKTERVEIKEVGSPRQVFPIITQEENRKNRLEREILFQEVEKSKNSSLFQNAIASIKEGSLAVLHNIDQQNISRVQEIGGLPSPSLAITKPSIGLDQFGDVTLIAHPSIAYETMESQRLFDRDVWSPIVPAAEWTINESVLRKFDSLVSKLSGKTTSAFSSFYKADITNGLESLVNQYKRLESVRSAFKADTNLEYASNNDAFTQWITNHVKDAYIEPRIKIGSRKYAYNAQNINRWMKSQGTVATQQAITYGASQAAAQAAIAFADRSQIQFAEGRLVNHQEQRDHWNSTIEPFMKKLDMDLYQSFQGESWEAFNLIYRGIGQYLAKYGQTSNVQAMQTILSDYGFSDVSIETVEAAVELANLFSFLPQDYFEAKPDRVMQLNEFVAAIVPLGMDESQRKILEDNGLQIFEYEEGDGGRTQAISLAYEELGRDLLFQEDDVITTDSDYNFSEFMLEEARGFDDYQELMSYYLAFADPDEQVVTDESWYQALWEKAHGIEEKTDLYEDDITRREQLREKAKEVNDAAKEATFLGEIEYSDNIVKFLKELGYIISSNRTWEDTADPIRRETVEYIKANAKKLIHPIIHANALRTLAGDREITIKSIRQIRTLMSGEGSSWYRDFYADVMDRPDLKSEIIDSRLPDIDQPSYRRLDNFSITDRVRLAEQIEATQLKKEFLSGKEKVDGVAEKIIKALDYEISKLHEDIAKYEADLEMLAAESLERKKEYAKNEYDYRKEIGSYDSAFWKIRNLAKEDAQFPKKSDPGSGFKFYGENKGNLLYEQVIKMRKSERMAETVKRQEALAKLKDKLTEKQKQRDDAKKVRQYKLQLARRIMAKPSDAINYEQARMIYEKQAPLDPAYRMARIVVDVGDQFQRMTIEEAKEFFANTTEEDIRKNIGDRNYERLTEKRRPLNEWTILELEDLAEDIANTRAEGRRILAAKKARQMEIARSIQADIMQSLIVDSRYKYKDRPIPGSHEEHMEKRSPFRSAKAFRYATFPMRSKAMMLDGDKMGSAYKLLITEKRNAQDAENRAIDKRIDPIVKLMMDLNVKDTDLYKTVSVALGTDKSVKMTYPALMYAYLSQFNPDNRNAVAYGNLVTQDEKATLKHDNASIKTLGDNRYQALIAQAEYHLSETPGMLEIAQAIQADFNNPEHVAKLQAIAIEEFNRPMREVESYLAIQRLSVDTEVMDEQIRDDLFNRNAGSLPTGVQKGFTKERINISPDHQRPVNMDLIQVWNRAVRQHEHFNAFSSYGRMVNRVFKGRGAVDIRNVIARTLGTEMLHDLDNYINDVINPIGDRKLKGMEKAVGFMRGNLGAAYLTWKMSSIVLQAITSPAPYLIEVNPIYMAKGYLDLMAHPIEAIDRINEMSPMMKHRTMNPMISDILERSKQYHTNLTSKTLYKAQEIGSLGLTWVDRYAVAGGWLGAYYQEKDKLMKSGMSEEQADARAIAYADDITLKTQPTGDATEIAPLFTQGSEFARAFTQFTTAMNVIWTNITYDMPVSARNLINKETPTEVKKREFSRVVGTIVGYGLAGAVLGAVQEGFKGEDDDWVAKLRRTIYWSFTQATESVPLIGRGVDAMIESLVTGDRVHVFSDNFFPGVDKLVQGVLHLTQEDFAKALQRLMEGTGYLIGAPVSGINQAIKTFKEGPKAMLGR